MFSLTGVISTVTLITMLLYVDVFTLIFQQLAQWGNSLEEALYRYGTSHHKAAAISTIDNHCKISYTLTYGKLESAHAKNSLKKSCGTCGHVVPNYCFYFLLGKLLSKAQKVAYTLLNKVGNPREGTSIMMGDRVCKKLNIFQTGITNPSN